MTQAMIVRSTCKLQVSRPSHAGEAQIVPPGITVGEMVTRYFQWKDIASGKRAQPASLSHSEITRLMKFIGKDAPSRSPESVFCTQLFDRALQFRAGAQFAQPRPCLRSRSDPLGIQRRHLPRRLRTHSEDRRVSLKPCQRCRLPKEMEVMLDGACPTSWPERDRCIAELLYCNLRVCEVVALNLEDMATMNFPLEVRAGESERSF